MKRAPKTQGVGWAVFETGEKSGTAHGPFEIQRIDCPEDAKGNLLAPAFADDWAAIRHVIRLAEAGDEAAITALWLCDQDPLVHAVLWGWTRAQWDRWAESTI